MPSVRILSVALAAALIAACGKDSSSPTAPATPAAPSVTGQWSYSTSNLVSGSATCGSSGTTLSITQSGTAFSGSYSGGTLTCSGPGGTFSGPIGGGVVVSGTISGSSVVFDLDTSDWRNTGTISGNSMSGTVTVRIVVSGSTYTLTGPWGASR